MNIVATGGEISIAALTNTVLEGGYWNLYNTHAILNGNNANFSAMGRVGKQGK